MTVLPCSQAGKNIYVDRRVLREQVSGLPDWQPRSLHTDDKHSHSVCSPRRLRVTLSWFQATDFAQL